MPNPQPAAIPAAEIAPRVAITALISLLEREQQLLAQPQADALETITEQKHALLKQWDVPNRSTCAAAHDPALRALVAHARQLNAANAKLLALHRASCESRLQLLRGGPSATTLYHANGYLGA